MRSSSLSCTFGWAVRACCHIGFVFGLIAALGCATVPSGRHSLNALQFSGNEAVDDDELEQAVASTPSPRFLGLFRGVIYDYEVFDRYVLERDLERVTRYYRARGYYHARVRAARVIISGRGARVYVQVEEGPPVLVRRVDVHGLDTLPAHEASRLRKVVEGKLALGSPFEEDGYKEARDELLRELANFGYAYATVKQSTDIDLPRNGASVGFWVEQGPKAKLGEVRIEGLGPLPEAPIRRALDLHQGTPYSQDELDEAKRALLDLGVFSAVSIEPELGSESSGGGSEIPILVRVERSKLRSVHLGGGVQADAQRTDVHLTMGWEDSNLLGGFRKLVLELVPGAVLYPTRLPHFETPERLLPQARARAEFRQPGFVEARTNAVIRAQASVYPILFSGARDPAVPVLGYRDVRAAVGVERSIRKLYGTFAHNVQANSPFAYVGALDADLGTVVISYPEVFAALDLRDDRVSPHKGAYLAVTAQVAGAGGDAQDVKLQPDVRGYLPVSRRITLGARASVGLLFPRNYGDTVAVNADTGTPGSADRRAWVRDIQLMFLRGFFSGGAGSNRGYAPRQIGPHGAVPFYNPGQTSLAQMASCANDNPERSAAVCDLPLGGFTLWEASLELRFPLMGPLTGAAFTDASDVAPHLAQFRLNHPHLSVGAGLRYDTPVGPVRFDLGFRIPGLQAPRTPDEGTPRDTFGLPIAMSFGIGESF